MKAKADADLSGTRVGTYDLLQLVGRGGMGTVYKARAPDGSIVAVKLLASELTKNEIQRRRFYQEAETAMRLDHPNIVRAVEVNESDGQHYFVMEFVDGTNVGSKLRDGKIPEDEAIAIISQIASALHLAHEKGLIHRDVKPDNILVSRTGDVRLADMGLVKQVDNDMNLTKTGRGLGTPHFMAPEQFKDAKHADARCDIYSLGATLYHMVTGELPFRGTGPLDTFMKKSKNEYTPPEKISPNLRPSTVKTIKLAMDPEPNRRPPTALSFAEMLQPRSGRDNGDSGRLSGPIHDAADDPFYYLVYVDTDGERKKVKGTAAVIEKQVREGRIPINAEASLSKKGPFVPLTQIDVFRPLRPEPLEERLKPAVSGAGIDRPPSGHSTPSPAETLNPTTTPNRRTSWPSMTSRKTFSSPSQSTPTMNLPKPKGAGFDNPKVLAVLAIFLGIILLLLALLLRKSL